MKLMKIEHHKDGYINELNVDGYNLIYPWSIEFADSYSFFSLENVGFGNLRTNWVTKRNGDGTRGKMDVEMKEGKVRLEYENIGIDNKIYRKASITALKDTYLMDFVIQYRFKKEFFEKGEIAGKTIRHRNSNIYYQYQVDRVELIGDRYKVLVKVKNFEGAEKFDRYMYIRDKGSEWIVHCRLIPKVADKEVIKLNVRWYNKAIPRILGNALLKNKKLRETLLYRSERKPYRKWLRPIKILNPSAYKLVRLEEGETVELATVMEVIKSSR
ncbi:MAG TPA: hypothetical protein ENI23_01150 [bacterium]|nr:hypothetical protein [bacterium]